MLNQRRSVRHAVGHLRFTRRGDTVFRLHRFCCQAATAPELLLRHFRFVAFVLHLVKYPILTTLQRHV